MSSLSFVQNKILCLLRDTDCLTLGNAKKQQSSNQNLHSSYSIVTSLVFKLLECITHCRALGCLGNWLQSTTIRPFGRSAKEILEFISDLLFLIVVAICLIETCNKCAPLFFLYFFRTYMKEILVFSLLVGRKMFVVVVFNSSSKKHHHQMS